MDSIIVRSNYSYMVLEENILLTPNQQTTLCLTWLHMTLQITLTCIITITLLAFLNLRQKVYLCL